ncbi:aspartic proteinase PCS1-like [Aristolochia californica]|uniref:aspartic proteinase PCS1-like n=1 Tax=Aristolochia californica TaxID=171875 RepID=UPI0035E155EE
MKPSFVSFFLLLFLSSVCLSSQRVLLSDGREGNEGGKGKNFSLSLPLVSLPLSHHPSSSLSLSSSAMKKQVRGSKISYKSSFRYTRALVLSLPMGTPPQTQQMVLDTGSQLSWIQCQKKKQSSCFNPSLSSTFSNLPCNTSLCKPPVPDFTIPTDCDPNRLCHYSYFYADGTLAEGNLVKEKITLSSSQTTPPIILGCARDAQPAEGILGMNLGRLSFTSQAGISKFSYCVPARLSLAIGNGAFYFGDNPNLRGQVRYVNLLRFDKQTGKGPLPYLDKAAYTVGMVGVHLGGIRLNIPPSVFRPDAGGAGQTMIDSGTEYTFLVEGAYVKIKAEVERVVGRRFRPRRGYVYAGGLDTCYEAHPAEIGLLVGDVAMEFEGGAQLLVEKERAWVDSGVGTACLSVGSSQLLGVESNIIGNFHQQDYWVEFDLSNSRVGILKADCRKAV